MDKILNPKQKQAVETINGPLLILAGPGSGKTATITHRIAYLIQKGISPNNILAITFTNKAANEMKQRVIKLCKKIPFIGTFHAFCLRTLRIEINNLDYKKNFVIYDTADQLKLIKRIIKQSDINKEQFPAKKVLSTISALKNELINWKTYQENAQEYFEKTISKLYEAYQKKLKKNNAVDFDDLIMLVVNLFEKFPKILEKYQERFKYILVDEYQDTNPSEYQLIKLLAEKYKNLCVVGDDSQAIFSFKGADYRNILNFEKDFPNAKTVILDQNYRSTQNILDAASEIISKNVYQKHKKLWTKNPKGPPISLISALDEKFEAEWIANKIKKSKLKLNDFTVFYRTNAQSRALEESFIRNNIPYKLIGAVKFYQRKEIKDIISYLKFIDTNDPISLERIINTPPRGIGEITFKQILQGEKKAKEFFSLIKKAKNKPFPEIIKYIIEKINYRDYLKKKYKDNLIRENIPEDEARWENIQELLRVAKDYNSLKEFLESISLLSDADEIDEQKETVHLMTLHTAKGLEFPVVFIIGCEEGILPHSKSLLNPLDIEEERRLFYVGITRSKKHLYLIFSQTRTSWDAKQANPPSRFLMEIPDNLIKYEGDIEEIQY